MDDWMNVSSSAPVAMERVGPVELPRLGAMVADTHAHLDMLDDPAGALERATIAGVMLIGSVVDATEAPEATFGMLPEWLAEAQQRLEHWEVAHPAAPEVRIVLGVHPHNAKAYDEAAAERIAELAADERVCAIGETGLDFHHKHSSPDEQRRAFRSQLALAHRLELPVVVHLREAHDEGHSILEEMGPPAAGCIIHCFGEGPEMAARFVDLGCHISFAGPVTFAKAEGVRAAAAAVPLERLLVETDCPFLAPEPYRGRTNEPAWVVLSVARIAEARGLSTAALAEQVYLNAHCMFTGTGSSAPA